MTKIRAETRRELWLFMLLAVLPALAVAGLFELQPWQTPMRQQADMLGWLPTVIYLAMGAAGVALLPSTGTALTPRLSDGRRWTRIVAVSLVLGLIYGFTDLGINRLTSWGAHLATVDAKNGFDVSFVNVRPPWSLAHYFHASIISECAFRLAAILIPAGLVGLLLRGRHKAATYWTFAVLAAMIEPLEKSVLLRKWALFGDTPTEQLMNLEAIAWQMAYAVLLRRFGWAAPILARFGYYLVVRCFHQ